jgi:glycosyltransferase involved in cell wall biosynthesis
MKILLVNSLYHPIVEGGAERSVQILAETYSLLDHSVAVLTLTPESSSSSEVLNGVRVYRVPLHNAYWPWNHGGRWDSMLWHWRDIDNGKMRESFGRVLDQERPQVVHSNGLAGFSVSVWKEASARGIPVVHTLRDYYLMCPKSNMYKSGKNCGAPCFACGLYGAPKRQATKWVQAVVGISRHLLESHERQGFFATTPKRAVIYNSYKPQTVVEPNPPTSRACLRVGYMGRILDEKGVGVLLAATSRLPTDAVEVLLAGSGDSDYVDGLKARYPGVRFLGYIPTPDLLNQIDVLAVPSLWNEPLGRVVLEAYAHGIPVIGSRRGGITELIDEGKTGFLFDPDSPVELDMAITRFLEDPNLALAMRANCLVKAQEFEPERIANLYLELYQELVREPAEAATCLTMNNA